ncbi:putative enoyl-CoA hydratase [Hyaloraphidium curvatum]|nr:putative enoyl-CoA hydratase [Hyaloraphidium curvatum]
MAFSAKSSYDLIEVTKDAGVATIYINNPPINLMTAALAGELIDVIPKLANDDAVRVVVMKSKVPGWFIAHFDVHFLDNHWPVMRAGELAAGSWSLTLGQQMTETLRRMPKPTIALINGRAGGGGCEMSQAMDMRFSGPNAIFNQMEVALGIIPGGGGTVRMPRLCGRSRAMEILLSSDDFSADIAEKYGLINRVFPSDEEAEAHVDRLAKRMAKFEPNAVARAKQCVLRAEKEVEADLIAELQDFNEVMKVDMWQENRRMHKYLTPEIGGQTVEGESKVGETVGRL